MFLLSIFDRIEIFALLIPICAIITGGVIAIVKLLTRHNERMAMIDRGIHPADPSETRQPADNASGRYGDNG